MRAALVALAAAYPNRARIPRHRHRTAQLIYAVSGVMTVTTKDGAWVVPPQRAVWVPPGVPHAIRMTGDVAMRTVYVARPLADQLPRACAVVHVTPLLRELVLRAASRRAPKPDAAVEVRIAALILDEIRTAAEAPLHLPRPSDPRLLRVTRALEAAPSNAQPLSELARSAGASARNLARLFQRETGMSFGRWRQQLRLLRALERVAAGEAVTLVALEVGYASPSAFIAMFRKALGVSPGRYFAGPARKRTGMRRGPLMNHE